MLKLKNSLLLLVIMISSTCIAQRFKVIPQVGVGNYIGTDEHNYGRGLIGIEGDVRITKKLDVGVLIAGGGDFIPTSEPELRNDMDTVEFNPLTHKYDLLSLVQRYQLISFPSGSFYIQATQGMSTLKFLNIGLRDDQSIRQQNFSFGLGAGLMLKKLDMKIHYYNHGAFDSFVSETVNNQYAFMMESSTGTILLQFGYVIGFGK
ncbi:MAG: hypothetical protein NXI20_01900 [bacterium]|nr:hypothetical protein [bacterium]